METNHNSSFDKLLCQTIKYNDSIKIVSKTLTEVYQIQSEREAEAMAKAQAEQAEKQEKGE